MHNAAWGTFVGIVTGVGVIIDEKTAIPIGAAITAAAVVLWVGRFIQRLLDAIDVLASEQKRLRIQIDSIPCRKDDCIVRHK